MSHERMYSEVSEALLSGLTYPKIPKDMVLEL
jgi:hypothetical protein